MNEFFEKAKPVWAHGREREVNLTCVFTAKFDGDAPAELRVTASCLYRVFVNGKFCGYGPARAAHGYFRADRVALDGLRAENTLTIEVAGYNTKSFYTLDQPSFLQAEIVRGGNVVKATGRRGDFVCTESSRLQRVPRFSYQRAFTEYYDLSRSLKPLECDTVGGGRLLPRGVDYPTYSDAEAAQAERGVFKSSSDKKFEHFDFASNERLGLYMPCEWERDAAAEACRYVYEIADKAGNRYESGEYGVWDLSRIETGFIRLKVRVSEPTKFYVTFDEIDGRADGSGPIDVDFLRNTTYNIVGYEVPCGEYELLSFEAYSARFIKIAVVSGAVEAESVGVKKFEHRFFEKYSFEGTDGKIAEIMLAAARTLAHNSVDLLTDCPSRERAGWLCDSFFSSRAELYFTGENKVERNFLENYALCPSLENVPEGMIPMCYPADFEKELFIPNWSLWYLIELYDYKLRTGDAALISDSKPKVDGLIKYFARFENEFGLLENLENWVFVEWSRANDADFVSGVNYPSNMLYAAALDCVSKLYGDGALHDKAERVRAAVRERSYNGEFFEDNELRHDGVLRKTGHTTETCQYYAFFFGAATPETHPELFEKLLCSFGPSRDAQTVYPSVFPSNAFIGNYLRLEILARYGYREQMRRESEEYFAYMARKTGTLWEHDRPGASLDHGFASYVACLLTQK